MMRIGTTNTFSARAGFWLVCRFAERNQDRWRDAIAKAWTAVVEFASWGGIQGVPLEVLRGAEHQWGLGACTVHCLQQSLNLDAIGMILRTLGNLRVEGDSLAHLEVSEMHGLSTPEDVSRCLRTFPRTSQVPFDLQMNATGSWIDLECNAAEHFPADVVTEMDRRIRVWVTVANAGGWQVEFDAEAHYGVGIEGPSVGEDFAQWQCQLDGVPPQSLSGLLNILGHLARTVHPIESVYLG
jgi:hypothetical protein